MSEATRGPPGGPPEGDPEEPLDLEELRQARELAAALAGEGQRGDPSVEEALRGAALVALAREPALTAGDVARLAPASGAHPAGKVASRRGSSFAVPRFAAVAALAAAVLAVVVIEGRRAAGPPAPVAAAPNAALVRGQAQELVASLLPGGGTPTGRARAVEASARARYQAAREAGR